MFSTRRKLFVVKISSKEIKQVFNYVNISDGCPKLFKSNKEEQQNKGNRTVKTCNVRKNTCKIAVKVPQHLRAYTLPTDKPSRRWLSQVTVECSAVTVREITSQQNVPTCILRNHNVLIMYHTIVEMERLLQTKHYTESYSGHLVIGVSDKPQ